MDRGEACAKSLSGGAADGDFRARAVFFALLGFEVLLDFLTIQVPFLYFWILRRVFQGLRSLQTWPKLFSAGRHREGPEKRLASIRLLL